MSGEIIKSPLGQSTIYPSLYDASLLFPIARSQSRQQLKIKTEFFGVDLWTAFEVSWLNSKGKPQVAVAEFYFDCHSPYIVESKSFKLYLNSLNQTRFDSQEKLQTILERDLSKVSGVPVTVKLFSADNFFSEQSINQQTLILLDNVDVEISEYHPNANLLQTSSNNRQVVSEILSSHLLKTNCPVTGQPDWASVFIDYQGVAIDRESLLRYIISFREHQDFHEHCIEQMFVDILEKCQPKKLSVYGRYTRRGGLDINPFRSTEKNAQPFIGRMIRQ